MKKNLLTSWLGLLLVLVVCGLSVALVKRMGLRVDVTEQRLYSLSQGSKELLKKLPEHADVTLKFYFSRSSEKMPMVFKAYADQVEHLLGSYAARSGGRVRVERFDPKPDSEAEEWAQRHGVEGRTLDPFAPPVYFGLAVVCGEREEVLPALDPRTEQTLEYDISRAIARVAWPRQPVVGVMSGVFNALGDEPDPMMPQRRPPNPGWVAFQQLRRDNAARRVETDVDAIPADITLLVVLHPKELPERTLYAIDQFVLRGGRLMVCADPLSMAEAMQAQGGLQSPPASSLAPLFDAWGVGFDPGRVVADLRAMTRVGTGNGGMEESPVFLTLRAENMNARHAPTARLGNVLFAFAGALEDRTAGDLIFTPMIETSPDNSALVDAMSAQYGVQAYRAQLEPTGRKYTVAARLNGTFRTAFPNGRPAPETPENPENGVAPHLASGESAVVIFADADFLADPFCAQSLPFNLGVQLVNDNVALFLNAAEQLAGRHELIAIRARGGSMRTFKVVEELELQAARQYREKEEELQRRLNEANAELQKLQAARADANSLMPSKEQQEQINLFKEQQRETTRQLKNVRRDLRQDIERLGTRVKAANILLVPVFVILVGIIRIGLRKHR